MSHDVTPRGFETSQVNMVIKLTKKLRHFALLSGFDWPEQRLLKKYSAEIRESYRMARMHPHNLVVILHAYGRRGFLGLR